MSAQEPIPSPGLIETLLWTRAEGYFLLEEHLARLWSSARVLGHACDEAKIRAALHQVSHNTDRSRVRLLLQHDGAIEITSQPLAVLAQGTVWWVAIASVQLNSADPMLAHKTTRRQFYDGERVRLAALVNADEAIFLNERDEVCEGGITTIFVEKGKVLITPPLSRGLLPGVLRGHLIRMGKAREGDVSLNDLRGGFLLGNSVRGLIPAQLVRSA